MLGINLPVNLIGVLFALLIVTAMSPLAFGQTEVHPIEVPSLEFANLEGTPISLESFFAGAEAVIIFFIKINADTQARGHDLARHLENEYQDERNRIPARVLIIAHEDSEGIQQVTDGIVLPILRGTNEVFDQYAVTAYTLYVLCIETGSGRIIARFNDPEDIESRKVDLAVQSCILSDYLIKASFDDGTRTSVFKTPEGTPLARSDITTRGEITCDFSNERRVGEQGYSIEISFPGGGEGAFGIDLAGTNLSQVGYLTMWILGSAGAEQFHIAIEDGNSVANQLLVSDYIRVLRSRWQRVCIPLTDFGLDLQNVSSVSLKFRGEETATIYVDDLMFLYRSARISGTVTEDGNPVDGATVTTNPETQTVPSDASGRYEIANISAGTYEVTAVKNGKRGSRSVTIEPGRDVTVDIQIGAGGSGQDETPDITETVEIELIIRIKEAPRGNGGSGVQLPIKGIVAALRFSVESGYQTELNEHTISDSLRQEFKNNGILLSQQVTILFADRENGNKEWLITDEENETEFLVVEKEDRLNIYVRGLDRLSTSEREQYKVVIYSQADLFYVQPYENDHYTTISANDEWSPPPPGIHLADREKTYMALLVKKTGSGWPLWPSSWSERPNVPYDEQISDIAPDGIQVLDMHQVPPLFKWRNTD